jgi:hypothetical protein
MLIDLGQAVSPVFVKERPFFAQQFLGCSLPLPPFVAAKRFRTLAPNARSGFGSLIRTLAMIGFRSPTVLPWETWCIQPRKAAVTAERLESY